MTDWIASRSFFCLNTTRKLPEIEQYYPNSTLTLYKALNGGVDIKTSFPQNWV